MAERIYAERLALSAMAGDPFAARSLAAAQSQIAAAQHAAAAQQVNRKIEKIRDINMKREKE